MASHRSRIVASDPNVVLALLERIDESDSDDDFDGWLGPDDGPIAYRDEFDANAPAIRHSLSLDSLDRPIEDPLNMSPSHATSSPMQTEATSPSLATAASSRPSPSPPSALYHATPQSSPHPPIFYHQNSASSNAMSQLSPPSFSATPGVIPNMEGKSPVDFFRLLFDSRVIDLVHTETIRYAGQYLEREKEHLDAHPHARAHDWQKQLLTHKEIEAFLALLIGMGICGFPTFR